MLTKLEPTQITQNCTGMIDEGTPCTGINVIPFSYLLLGQSDLQYLEVGTQAGGIRLYAKKATSIALVNSKASASLSSVLAGSVLTVTLADDGANVTTTYAQLKVEIEAKAGANFICRTYGATNTVVAELALTALTYRAGTPRTNKNLIICPVCPVCGITTEFLIRDFTVVPPSYVDTPNGRLKLAVNFLGTKLKQAGQINYICEAAIGAEASDPPSQLPGWPVGGYFLIDP